MFLARWLFGLGLDDWLDMPVDEQSMLTRGMNRWLPAILGGGMGGESSGARQLSVDDLTIDTSGV